MNLNLQAKQFAFSRCVAQLLTAAMRMGYDVTLGEAWRTLEQAKLNAHSGKGIAGSLHCDRLAIDLNVFRNGQWLQDGADFAELGECWESLSPADGSYECVWGYRFSRPDPFHFSIRHAGRA